MYAGQQAKAPVVNASAAGASTLRDSRPRVRAKTWLIGPGRYLLLACALLLPRNMRAGFSSFRKADGDGLFAAFYLLARTSASKRATLSFVHGALHFAACAALTLGSHTNLVKRLWIVIATRAYERAIPRREH